MPSQPETESQNTPTERHRPAIEQIADLLEEEGYSLCLQNGDSPSGETTTPHIEIRAPVTDRETLEGSIHNLKLAASFRLIGPTNTAALPDRTDTDSQNTTFYIVPGTRIWSPVEIAEKRASFI